MAARLAAAGLRGGDRVLVSAQASARLAVAYLGALRLGLLAVPANTAYRERELAHMVEDAEPRAAIVDDRQRAEWLRGRGVEVVAGVDVDLPDGPPVELDLAAPGDGMLLCYTSGTTGAPKGALLSHANLLAGAEALRIAWRWSADDRLVGALPLFHMHGLGVGLHGTLLAGASAVIVPRFEPTAVLDAAGAHDATLFFGVPTMYASLLESPRAQELARLRLCVSGSAPLSPSLFTRFEHLTGTRILERYGMTETMMLASNPYEGPRRAGTVGLPLPGVEIRLEENGEVLVRGPNVFSGYWRRPEATREAFDGDWFRTGDVGEFDEDGYLRLVGRAKELIITGGYNVYPREVEDVLREHPDVEDAAVVGKPDPKWGEVVTAFVVSRAAVGESDLAEFASERLASYKRPRIVRFVDELPRNALGKVLKNELRDQ